MVAANEIELESRIILADVVDQDFKLEKSQEPRIIDSFQSDIKCQPQIIANRAHIWLKGYAAVCSRRGRKNWRYFFSKFGISQCHMSPLFKVQ